METQKQVYEMTIEERQAYIKMKALNTMKTKYKNIFDIIEELERMNTYGK